VNERTGLSAVMALKLAATFNTTAEFWLNAQKAMDLYIAEKITKICHFRSGNCIKLILC
jgi:addiction module HigA family antidote